jgi:hypothetical protein
LGADSAAGLKQRDFLNGQGRAMAENQFSGLVKVELAVHGFGKYTLVDD